jgi:hypothetical protein
MAVGVPNPPGRAVKVCRALSEDDETVVDVV